MFVYISKPRCFRSDCWRFSSRHPTGNPSKPHQPCASIARNSIPTYRPAVERASRISRPPIPVKEPSKQNVIGTWFLLEKPISHATAAWPQWIFGREGSAHFFCHIFCVCARPRNFPFPFPPRLFTHWHYLPRCRTQLPFPRGAPVPMSFVSPSA